MKNIHVLPTSQPSTLIKDLWKNTFFLVGDFATNHTDFKAQHIYITSDEKFVIDEYITDGIEVIKSTPKLVDGQGLLNRRDWKKVILSTDQDLIKDDVQAIDDEFLEWFVQNPSCEEVETERFYSMSQSTYSGIEYEIIIPKEEPKLSNICIKCGVDLYATEGRFECQKHPKECKGIYLSEETLLTHTAEELGLYEEPKQENCCTPEGQIKRYKDCKGCSKEPKTDYFYFIKQKEKEFKNFLKKQETLEEAAERFYGEEEIVNDYDISGYLQSAFLTGAKWQQERSYSGQEVFNLLMEFSSRDINSSSGTPHSVANWFEQFKKK
jgi:hypothetical protein